MAFLRFRHHRRAQPRGCVSLVVVCRVPATLCSSSLLPACWLITKPGLPTLPRLARHIAYYGRKAGAADADIAIMQHDSPVRAYAFASHELIIVSVRPEAVRDEQVRESAVASA